MQPPPGLPGATLSAPRGDRRRHARHTFHAELRYRTDTLHVAQGLDLSESGVAAVVTEALEPGARVNLYRLHGLVDMPGTVRHRQALTHGCYRVGVAFDVPQPGLLQRLEAR
jgi:PilZ domain